MVAESDSVLIYLNRRYSSVKCVKSAVIRLRTVHGTLRFFYEHLGTGRGRGRFASVDGRHIFSRAVVDSHQKSSAHAHVFRTQRGVAKHHGDNGVHGVSAFRQHVPIRKRNFKKKYTQEKIFDGMSGDRKTVAGADGKNEMCNE